MQTLRHTACAARLAGLLLAVSTTLAAADPPPAGTTPRAAPADAAGAANRGRLTFVRVGCSECHGTEGQGSSAGRRLAPDPLPLAALIPFVRAASGQMPSYGAALLSDAELGDIRAYLASIPPARPAASIPALRELRDSD